MKSLVTGGSGFIGSNIVDKLLDLGHEVVVIDNESSTDSDFRHINKNASYYKLDVQDYLATRFLYDNVDYVFHLAALVRIQETINDPIKAVESNVLATAVALQCAKEAGVKRFILSSTSAVYGDNQIPNIETQNVDLKNPYSVTKFSSENLCKMYFELFGLETISFRYSNVYGDRMPSRGDYAPVIGIFLKQKNNNQYLTITGDGAQKRDFICVNDVVDANIAAINKDLLTDSIGTVYNIGYGSNYSILDIAKMISGENYKFIPARSGESKETLLDINKIQKAFGWQPKINLVDWIKKQV
jgi:UDP-glucose 4-epimerase